jgi:hypothetical protein
VPFESAGADPAAVAASAGATASLRIREAISPRGQDSKRGSPLCFIQEPEAGESEALNLDTSGYQKVSSFVCHWRTATGRPRNSELSSRKSRQDTGGSFFVWSGAISTGVRGHSVTESLS